MISLAEILSDWPLWGLSTKPVEADQIQPLSGGLTNLCYQLSLETGEYIPVSYTHLTLPTIYSV